MSTIRLAAALAQPRGTRLKIQFSTYILIRYGIIPITISVSRARTHARGGKFVGERYFFRKVNLNRYLKISRLSEYSKNRHFSVCLLTPVPLIYKL